ncbi:MAG TPA: hypothetical protein VKV04_17400 [Verrucomicrobiae bacterium]|nr:hypothetical protein [Verrucomicrobiae bacterium]
MRVVNKDRLSAAKRSWNMSRIRGKDTTPEKIVRSVLHWMGYRFCLHVKIPIQLRRQEVRKRETKNSKFKVKKAERRLPSRGSLLTTQNFGLIHKTSPCPKIGHMRKLRQSWPITLRCSKKISPG